jgi:2,3-bisphosphoglycerate-dependent phosphoglycerate mutase
MSRRLVLVRHGRVDFASREFTNTVRGRQWDPPLGDAGREQAAQVAARLASVDPPAGLYVSPFRRCRETLAPYAERTGLSGVIEESLGEVFVGEWEGVPFEDLIAENEDFIRRRLRDHEAIFAQAPGAERGPELRARVVPAVERMLAETGDGDVLVIAHGGVINAYLGHVLGLDQDMFFLPENTSLNVVDVDGDERRVRFINDVAHLYLPALWDGSADYTSPARDTAQPRP